MRKTLVSVVVIGTFIAYCLIHNQPNAVAIVPQTSSSTTSSAPASTTTAGSASAAIHYKDGSYVGPVTDAQWGTVQVKAVVQGGKLTDVQWLQYPNDRNRSIEINQIADPQLTSEAIQAQNYQVDVVTGATDSSVAFMQSLSDALSQAQG